ncbi:GNAT family N-acetyltransferase [Pseudoalteromonas sp. SR44-8]|uniref:GNAT family N-acetyltransferase n=1 Tax=Pseudoalteromonas sp. SR44-8 TaxID=2760933 RepID=UPI002872BADC|nr:GNAT family N-acetyltransferase [Pseudoalteromonas sp. SR44-8]
MKSVSYTVELSCPSLEEFCLLREKVGWGKVNADLANTSLNNSLFHVVIRQEGLLVGMGRVIGDGGLFFYIQDVVVDPDFQRQGIGALIMDNIEMYLAGAAKKDATIGLLSAKGKESFYARYGYFSRPDKILGCGMCKFT